MDSLENTIDSYFYMADEDAPECETVRDLVRELRKLPPDLPLADMYEVIVYNIKTDPIVRIEEIH